MSLDTSSGGTCRALSLAYWQYCPRGSTPSRKYSPSSVRPFCWLRCKGSLCTPDGLQEERFVEPLIDYCSGEPTIIGEWNPTSSQSVLSEREEPYRYQAAIWLQLTGARVSPSPEHSPALVRTADQPANQPRLTTLFCCGVPYTVSYHIVDYRSPSAEGLQYYSTRACNPYAPVYVPIRFVRNRR